MDIISSINCVKTFLNFVPAQEMICEPQFRQRKGYIGIVGAPIPRLNHFVH
jgi:hypothetical protein